MVKLYEQVKITLYTSQIAFHNDHVGLGPPKQYFLFIHSLNKHILLSKFLGIRNATINKTEIVDFVELMF